MAKPLRRNRNTKRWPFIAAGVAVSVLLIGVAAQVMPTGRFSVSEGPSSEPDLASFLPASARHQPGAWASLVAPDPAVAVGYLADATWRLAAVGWDRQAGEYVLRSTVIFSGEEFRAAPSAVSLLPVGKDTAWVVKLTGAAPERACLALASGQEVRPLVIVHSGRNVGPCFAAASVSLDDIDFNGVRELIVRGESIVDVYHWDGQGFSFSEPLSWAMTADRGLFPEMK